MQTLDLGGEWTLKQAGKLVDIPATVPGCVHMDLQSAGLIPDPYYRDNESSLQWIGEKDWVYSRRFVISRDFLKHDRVRLRFEGLDTLAAVILNGRKIGETDNMFRTWEFDVKSWLKTGENILTVRFKSVTPHIRKREKERHLPAWKGPLDVQGGSWVRKEPCNFGWDWGPVLVTCGIWRQVSLSAYDSAKLNDVHVRQKHLEGGPVRLDFAIQAEEVRKKALQAEIKVSFNGRDAVSAGVPLRGSKGKVSLTIDDPQLWWPRGLGGQPLYEVSVRLLDEQGRELDNWTRHIGLRKLGLDRKKDRWGESYGFSVNGVSFFARGANWIPADTFAPRLTENDYRDLLQSAADANMNMLRVWGGGIYEPDIFYDICDELGICVWQDFMFACSAYPSFDDTFMENVRGEVRDNVKRLRHHACLALWCGNNELEPYLLADEWDDGHMSWSDYEKLFDVLIPETVRRYDPGRDYWPCSPHVPHDRRRFADDRWGDAHLWQVWHGKLPFEWYRTSRHRFVSEFGFQSFPEPRTVETYTLPEDRNITGYVMEHHQRSPIGNTTIMTYMLEWFRLPSSFENTLWLSQVLQGIGMKYAVEHWRRSMPRTMGALYWQLNDCWPVASWSSIDYYHRWKALHYMAKRFFAPVLVSAVEDAVKGTLEVWITSDRREKQAGRLDFTITGLDGKTIRQGSLNVEIPPGKSRRVTVLDLKNEFKEYGPRNIVVWLELAVNREIVSSDAALFARPKHLELPDPEIEARMEGNTIVLRSGKPALWAWLELEGMDARFSDNFFHLAPGKEARISVKAPGTLPGDAGKLLKVRSLRDTYMPC